MTPTLPALRALTLWPEWCPAFPGVRLRDGEPSPLDKPVENRPRAPWSTIAPTVRGSGPWVAMHAGKHIGGRPGNEGALGDVIATARAAGWHASVMGDAVVLRKRGAGEVALYPDRIVTSAIVALFRITRVVGPGIDGPWRFRDRWGWYVDVVPLPEPIACSGAQGLWTVPEDVRARIEVPDAGRALRDAGGLRLPEVA